LPACRDYLVGRYVHLIADNVEEDTPVAHDLLAEWLPLCRSALVIYDSDAGYRRFLGADPVSACRFRELCDDRLVFTGSLVASPEVQALAYRVARGLGRPSAATIQKSGSSPSEGARAALGFASHRYHPQMLDWVADEIARLVHDRGVPAGEIAVLAPFLSGALRFSLTNRLEGRGIPVRSHRPSRALREEPATECLLTLAALCHPAWGVHPARYDVAYALMQALDEMDLVRAQLLTEIAHRFQGGAPVLGPFDEIEPEMQERITFLLGGRYEGLRAWLNAHTADGRGRARQGEELDHFLARLFGELLSQPGYGFHRNYDAGEVAANLIESVRKFRQVMAQEHPLDRQSEILRSAQNEEKAADEKSLGQEYVEMVRDGVVAAQYVRSWQRQPEDAVLLAPAYTFLMSNRPVAHQFWLDVGSTGWWERLYQPLTHPYVLSRRWPAGKPWTDADEYEARQDALGCLALGLIRRCRRQIHLGLSEMGEQGHEQRGPLLQAIQHVLRAG
jgi:hypothetical protein